MRLRYGTPSEAADTLGMDVADIWMLVAAGTLEAVHEQGADGPWGIYREVPDP